VVVKPHVSLQQITRKDVPLLRDWLWPLRNLAGELELHSVRQPRTTAKEGDRQKNQLRGVPGAAGAGVGIEIRHPQPRQLLVAGAGLKRCLHEDSEITLRRIDQPLRFGNGKIPSPRNIATPRNNSTRCQASFDSTLFSRQARFNAALRRPKQRLADACRFRCVSGS
jgi:hypothetical protein